MLQHWALADKAVKQSQFNQSRGALVIQTFLSFLLLFQIPENFKMRGN